MADRLKLRIISGELKDKVFEVKEGGLRLGRSSSNDIHIPDEELSRNHCLFERVGDAGVRLTDLASANGTVLNGTMLGSEPVELKDGDIIVVGATSVEVIDEEKRQREAAKVDLGLGTATQPGTPAKRRSPLANILWLVAVLVAGAAIYLVLNAPVEKETAPAPVAETEPVLSEAYYEHVAASREGIFRYEMKFSVDGVLAVRIDDVPGQNRHHVKSLPLSDAQKDELGKILAFRLIKDIDREYAGVEPDPPALDSWKLRVVYSSRARTISIVNTQEPDAFRQIRERLEAFCKSELGIWAIQYPKEKLLELAAEAVVLGNAKWEDRDVNYGNLSASIAAFKEALFYLETIDPKPEVFTTAREGLARSVAELDKRYADQRFLADRALNLGQFEVAKKELLVLLEMVPDRADDRYRDASEKLIAAEKKLKEGGAK